MYSGKYINPIVCTLPFLICALVYLPGLTGGFLFDDYPNITNNSAVHLHTLSFNSLKQAAFSSYSGKLQRPVSMVSFAINHWATNSLNAYGFKAFNLILHILNGVLLFVFLKLLLNNAILPQPSQLKKDWIIIAIVFAWLISPLNVSTVLYIVQRMAMLSAFFSLSGLISYILFREYLNQAQKGKSLFFLFLFIVCCGLATLSKENGILLPYFALLLEAAFFRFTTNSQAGKAFLWICSVSLVIFLLAILFWLLIVNPDYIFSGYKTRSFTLHERLLTESRVMLWYIQSLIIPLNTTLGLFHDDFVVSTSLFNPISTILAVTSLGTIFFAGILAVKKLPFIGFGLLFFFLGHSLESTILPLEIIFEHRNYLSGIGIYIAIFFAFGRISELSKRLTTHKILLLVFALFFTFSTAARTYAWNNNLSLAITQVQNHPDSARARTLLGKELLFFASFLENIQEKERLETLALKELTQATILNPEQTGANFIIISLLYNKNKEIDKKWSSLLENQLANGKYDAGAINHLSYLVDQAISNTDDAFPTETIKRLLQATTKNPNIRGRSKAELYTLTSKFLLLVDHDNEYALYFIAQAADIVPSNPMYRVHLAMVLHNLGKLQEACDELRVAMKIDRFGKEARKINKLQNQIGVCNKA
jgi:tetratricopeptide (TPR) repeat protein